MDRQAAPAGGNGPGNPRQQGNRSRGPQRYHPYERLRGAARNSPSNVVATRSLQILPSPDTQSSLPLAPRQTTPPKQGKLILTYIEEFDKAVTGGTNTKSVYEILTDIQHDKILWLALHGVPGRSVAFEMRTEVEKLRPSTPLEIHVSTLARFIELTIGEIATGGDLDLDRFIENLMASATRHFDRTTLHRAMEHALLDKRGKIGSGRDERQNLRRGHKNIDEKLAALARWREQAGGAGPGKDPAAGLKLDFPKRIKALAIEGLELEKMKDKIEEKLGYEEGKAVKERAVMKQRLLEIRQTWSIARRFEDEE
jgi:hypothetical protein